MGFPVLAATVELMMIQLKSVLRLIFAALIFLLLPEVVVGLVAFVDWAFSISKIPLHAATVSIFGNCCFSL